MTEKKFCPHCGKPLSEKKKKKSRDTSKKKESYIFPVFDPPLFKS